MSQQSSIGDYFNINMQCHLIKSMSRQMSMSRQISVCRVKPFTSNLEELNIFRNPAGPRTFDLLNKNK